MADGQREFYTTIYSTAGFAQEFQELTESDFAATIGLAYTPPEMGDYRIIDVARTIQLLANVCNTIATSHTSDTANLRMPCGLVSTDDALPGRVIYIKNVGTKILYIQDHLGNNLLEMQPNHFVAMQHRDNNNWEVFVKAENIFFDNSTNEFTSTNVQTAIEEAKNTSICLFKAVTHTRNAAGSILKTFDSYSQTHIDSEPFIVIDSNGEIVSSGAE